MTARSLQRHGCQRRAEFVCRLRDEEPFPVERALDPLELGVEGNQEAAEFGGSMLGFERAEVGGLPGIHLMGEPVDRSP